MKESDVYMEAPDKTAEEGVQPVDAVPASTSLTFEDKCARATKIMDQNPNYRKVFYRILRRCDGESRPLDELEKFVETQPGYAQLKQPPYFPIHWLEQAYALEEQYLDADGLLYAKEDLSELDEDGFDELVVQYAYQTTDVGRKMLQDFDPKGLVSQLIDAAARPGEPELYRDVLHFLEDKHSFAEIDHAFRARVQEIVGEVSARANPGIYIDKLSAAGGIVFDGGWMVTDEGRELVNLLDIESE